MTGKWKVGQFAALGAALGLLYGLFDALNHGGWGPEDIAFKLGSIVGAMLISIAGFVLVAVVRNAAVARFGRRGPKPAPGRRS